MWSTKATCRPGKCLLFLYMHYSNFYSEGLGPSATHFFQVFLDCWASIVATVSDSKTLPHRETNFLLLQRLMIFFLDTKEISWLMNFAMTLDGNGSRLLFSLFHQNRFAQQLFVGYWISQGAVPVPAENQWSALVLGEKVVGAEPFWGKGALLKTCQLLPKPTRRTALVGSREPVGLGGLCWWYSPLGENTWGLKEPVVLSD